MFRQPYPVEKRRHAPSSGAFWGGLLRLLAVAPLAVCVFVAFLLCLPFALIDLVRKYL